MRKQQGRVSGESVIVAFLLLREPLPAICCASACGRRWVLVKRLRFMHPYDDAASPSPARLDALDHWLDGQEKAGVPSSEHALLTRVVDETGAACGELQGGLEGEEPATMTQSQSAQ